MSLIPFAVVSALCCSVVLGCSEPVGVEIDYYNLEQTLAMAPIVVSGTDVIHNSESYMKKNYTFQVSCVFKSNELDIPRTIYILHVGDQTTCDGSRMFNGTSYLVGLQVASEDDITRAAAGGDYLGQGTDDPYYYVEYKPNVYNSAVFDLEDEDLSKVSSLCGMDNSTRSLGAGEAGDHECPSREVTDETCVTASGASRLMSAHMTLIPYNSKILGLLLSLAVCALLSLVFVM